MRVMKSSIIAATLLATIAGANAQGREQLNTGIHGATSMKRSGQSITPQGYIYRDAYASGHAYRNKTPQSGPLAPANPTLDNIHGGPAS